MDTLQRRLDSSRAEPAEQGLKQNLFKKDAAALAAAAPSTATAAAIAASNKKGTSVLFFHFVVYRCPHRHGRHCQRRWQ